MTLVAFIGGPLDGRKVELSGTPPRVEGSGVIYNRIDDPDTGEFLGGYLYTEPVPKNELVRVGRALYGRCSRCDSLVRLNKKFFGSFHICAEDS